MAPRSERDSLAAAISRSDAAGAELERIDSALARVGGVIAAAVSRLENAERAIAEINLTDPGHLAAAFLGEVETAASQVALKKECADASEAVRLARETRGGLEERRRAAHREVDMATHLRDLAQCAVVRDSPELAALIAQYEAARLEVARMVRVFEAIGTLHMPPNYHWAVARPYNGAPGDDLLAWRAALAALKVDAHARLPATFVATKPAA